MRFRLRTLLIAVAIFGIVMARVAHFKRQRDFHRHEAEKLAPQLNEFLTADELHASLEYAVTMGPRAGMSGGGVIPSWWSRHTDVQRRRMWDIWTSARDHSILARRYDQAMYRPWTRVWADPDSVPDKVTFIDFRLAALCALMVAIVLAPWQIIRRFRRTSSDHVHSSPKT